MQVLVSKDYDDNRSITCLSQHLVIDAASAAIEPKLLLIISVNVDILLKINNVLVFIIKY